MFLMVFLNVNTLSVSFSGDARAFFPGLCDGRMSDQFYRKLSLRFGGIAHIYTHRKQCLYFSFDLIFVLYRLVLTLQHQMVTHLNRHRCILLTHTNQTNISKH